jgi:hypothetical protein
MYNVVEETPVDACYAVKCDKCGKTTWKVRTVQAVFDFFLFSLFG